MQYILSNNSSLPLKNQGSYTFIKLDENQFKSHMDFAIKNRCLSTCLNNEYVKKAIEERYGIYVDEFKVDEINLNPGDNILVAHSEKSIFDPYDDQEKIEYYIIMFNYEL